MTGGAGGLGAAIVERFHAEGAEVAIADLRQEAIARVQERLGHERTLALPTLIIWGDRDTTTPLPQGQRLAQVIAGDDLAVMPGIGHMPQLEDVDQFNRLLLTFLERQRGARP